MLNGNSSYPARESAAPWLLTSHQKILKVGLDTGCCGLSRLANLMAKLDIEPDQLRAEKSACGRVLEVTIGFGEDGGAMDCFILRLSGMVSLRYLEPGPMALEVDATSRRCELSALDAGAV